MVTPGVAGAMTMMIANTLASTFLFPRAWVGLGLSFLFGLLVLVSDRRLMIKGVFYLINSFVIFCVAQGANNVGVQTTTSSLTSRLSIATSALASPAATNLLLAQAVGTADLQAQYDALSKRYAEVSLALDAARANAAPQTEIDGLAQSLTTLDAQRQQILGQIVTQAAIQHTQKSFFAPWKF
jgi:hypothetical protein